MSKSETFRRSAQQVSEQRVASLKEQLSALSAMHTRVHEQAEALKQAQSETPDALASALLPVARSMATLSQETRQVLHALVQHGVQAQKAAATEARAATAAAQTAADRMQKAAAMTAKAVHAMQRTQRLHRRTLWLTASLAACGPVLTLFLAWRTGLL